VSDAAAAERASLSAVIATRRLVQRGIQSQAEVGRGPTAAFPTFKSAVTTNVFNYSYVTAADIAGARLATRSPNFEVVVIPRLESIFTRHFADQGYPDRLHSRRDDLHLHGREQREELTVKMPGEGRDPGDKGTLQGHDWGR